VLHPQQSANEAANEPSTARYGVVVEPAIHDSPQPPANDPDVVIPSPPQDPINAFQGAIDPLRHRLAPELKSTSPGRRAVVREGGRDMGTGKSRSDPETVRHAQGLTDRVDHLVRPAWQGFAAADPGPRALPPTRMSVTAYMEPFRVRLNGATPCSG